MCSAHPEAFRYSDDAEDEPQGYDARRYRRKHGYHDAVDGSVVKDSDIEWTTRLRLVGKQPDGSGREVYNVSAEH